MNKYIVTFEDHKMVLGEDELLQFVKIAVINNKGISSFSVHRTDAEPTRMQVVEAAFIRIFNI